MKVEVGNSLVHLYTEYKPLELEIKPKGKRTLLETVDKKKLIDNGEF